MLKRLILAAMQIVGGFLTVLVSFGYVYLRTNALPVTVVACALALGGVYWATLNLDARLGPWGDRLLGAAFAACVFVLWGQVRQARPSLRRNVSVRRRDVV
ncbi:MAG: hypothetical protein HDKAJFGB_03116 [Anaerolineae bacterium]|nr:hypothetical protein [Anaerolineae bacterium]